MSIVYSNTAAGMHGNHFAVSLNGQSSNGQPQYEERDLWSSPPKTLYLPTRRAIYLGAFLHSVTPVTIQGDEIGQRSRLPGRKQNQTLDVPFFVLR